MVKFEVCNWTFEEDIYYRDRLCFRTNGLGNVFVEFDLLNVPHLRQEDGNVFFRLSPEIEVQVIAKIKEAYPNGFHKRIEENLSWLRKKIQALQDKKRFELLNLIPYGGIKIDDFYYDSYRGELKVDDTVQTVIIAANSFHNKMFVYRQYINSSNPAKAITPQLHLYNNEELQIVSEDLENRRIITNQYVACSCFEYDFGGALKRELIALRDDLRGGNFRSYLGNFFISRMGSLSLAG